MPSGNRSLKRLDLIPKLNTATMISRSAVDASSSRAGGGDRIEHVVDLLGSDLLDRHIAEPGHDETGGCAAAAFVDLPGFAQVGAVAAQRRGCRILDLLEPRQIRVGDLAERDATVLALELDTLDVSRIREVLGNDDGGLDDRGALVVEALLYTSTTRTPALAVGLKPRLPIASVVRFPS